MQNLEEIYWEIINQLKLILIPQMTQILIETETQNRQSLYDEELLAFIGLGAVDCAFAPDVIQGMRDLWENGKINKKIK